jgi:hypothetical protein
VFTTSVALVLVVVAPLGSCTQPGLYVDGAADTSKATAVTMWNTA